ncbi:MAG: OmpA family protein [Phycisphaerales bacterium]|jgi:chemotaxis protein MotB|nr:OmpA family protein [Phycisphaerales bacterium]
MRHTFIIALTGTIGSGFLFASSGCVQQDKYDQLLKSYRSTQEQLVASDEERDVSRANAETLRRQLALALDELDQSGQQIESLQSTVNEHAVSTDQALARISQLEFGKLPADVSVALEALSRQYPDLILFDPQLDMLRLKSDVTFSPGKTALTEEARTTLIEIAHILSTDGGQQLEVTVVGHTDDVPISASRNNHKTNTHLSVHRAISVRDILVEGGVSPQNVMVAGFGENRPLIANEVGGTQANRRVEIFLAPMAEPMTSMGTTTEVEFAANESTAISSTPQESDSSNEPMK